MQFGDLREPIGYLLAVLALLCAIVPLVIVRRRRRRARRRYGTYFDRG